MEIKNILIVGITGGIGHAFLQESANLDLDLQISGCFNKDLDKVDSIVTFFPNVHLWQIDLSRQNLFDYQFDRKM